VAKKQTVKLNQTLDDTFARIEDAVQRHRASTQIEEVGHLAAIGRGIAWVTGLARLESEELVALPDHKMGIAFNLDAHETGIVLLDHTGTMSAGEQVFRTGKVLDTPVGEALLGRVVDPLGRPLDERGSIRATERRNMEREAAAVLDRSPVTVPLQTGTLVIDALTPIGRGQRELLVGDRQTGKTAVALDAIINQHDKGVFCVYCAIGQETGKVAKVVADLRDHGAMDYTIVVMASSEDTAGMNYVAPYAATAMAEYFMDLGKDALIVYDDLTRHARSYRELSLLLRRPPAREAFPGDIFYLHSRLLERSAHLKDGGSLTALPVIETEAQDISAYIPTNLISITDGQVFFSPQLFQEGTLPAIDIGLSVSRVGGKTQLPAYRGVAGDLRLSYSQYRELESFARFGTNLDKDTRESLQRGRRVRETLKQARYQPMPAPEQVAVLLAVTSGVFDGVGLADVAKAKDKVRKAIREQERDVYDGIAAGKKLSEEDRNSLVEKFRTALGHSE
jgi:F-type H+-transporting ATPase subunit alpha